MTDAKGRFVKGERSSPATEFKPGQHWRPPQLFRDRDWLYEEYVNKKRSYQEIADEFGVTHAAIRHWIRKHGIKSRTTSQARAVKHWSLKGEKNGMYGRGGEKNPRWLGGVSGERQTAYSSAEWAEAVRIVWLRDKGVCQRCGKKECLVHIHHIISFSVVETRSDPDNLTTLCVDCHHWVHSRANTAHEFIREEGANESLESDRGGRTE